MPTRRRAATTCRATSLSSPTTKHRSPCSAAPRSTPCAPRRRDFFGPGYAVMGSLRNSLTVLAVASLAGLASHGPSRADANNKVLTIGSQSESFTLDPAMGVGGNDYPYLYT